MKSEGSAFDKKSLRAVTGKTADWNELAKDAVAFANARGGDLLIGIEDDQDEPNPVQRIEPSVPDLIMRRIGELTVNVEAIPEIRTGVSGGQYLAVRIPRASSVASTSSGRYFIRVDDESKPVLGDEILRLANERAAFPWETQTTQQVSRRNVDPAKFAALAAALRASDRVKESVKQKTDGELLDHYLLARGEVLTNLGVLCVGARQDRAQLGTAPVIQAIKYDDRGIKVNKWVWDDYELSPMELVEAVWREVPEFRERFELPDGLYRQNIPAYDEVVVRELLINALVHRPYTQRGDIFLNLHPDRMEVVNPGLLPLGVTPANVLHVTVRRNEHLARLFHDLKLMEREGSGFDRIYEVLLSQGRPVPELREGYDRVEVIVRRRIMKPEIIDLMAKADESFQLTQRERIVFGILAQHDSMTAFELTEILELKDVEALSSWMARLPELGIVESSGRSRGMKYFINPSVFERMDFSSVTTLRRIEPHRLKALVMEDLSRYPGSAIGAINSRIGKEVPRSQVKRALDRLVEEKQIRSEGEKRWRRYLPVR